MYHINFFHSSYNTPSHPGAALSAPQQPKSTKQHQTSNSGGKRNRGSADEETINQSSKKRGKKAEEDIDLETLKRIQALEWERKHG